MKTSQFQVNKGLKQSLSQRLLSKKHLSGWLILSTLILSGCTCNDKQAKDNKVQADATQVDSLQRELPFAHHEFIFDTSTVSWLSGAMGGKDLDSNSFKDEQATLSTDSTLGDADAAIGHFGDTSQITESQDYYAQFQPFIRKSPDSLHLIDFGSYNHIVVKDKEGQTKLEGGEPDSKVEVLDLKAGLKWQILYGGPGLHIMDAKWKDKKHFMVLFSNEQNSGVDTVLLTGDIDSKTLRWYKLGDQ